MGVLEDMRSYHSHCLPDAPEVFGRAWGRWVLGVDLGPFVTMNFATPVYPNINPILLGRSGTWKTQSINLAKDIIRRVMPDEELGETFTESGMTEELKDRADKCNPHQPEGYLIVDEFGHLIELQGADWNKGVRDYSIKLLDGECKGRLIKKDKSQLLSFPVRVTILTATTLSRATHILEKHDVLDGFVPRLWPEIYVGRLQDSMPSGFGPTETRMRDAIVAKLKYLRNTVRSNPVVINHSPSTHLMWMDVTKRMRRKVRKLVTHDAYVNQAKVHFHRICMQEEVSMAGALSSSLTLSDSSAEVATEEVMRYCSSSGLLYSKIGSSKAMYDMLDIIEQTMPNGVTVSRLKKAMGVDGTTFYRALNGLVFCEKIVESKKKGKTKSFKVWKLAKK